jgi:hypothetical protein
MTAFIITRIQTGDYDRWRPMFEGVSDPLCRHDEIEGASCLRRPALI